MGHLRKASRECDMAILVGDSKRMKFAAVQIEWT